jgi:hypothetical protein
MEEIRKCIYCNEVMTYGLQPQIISSNIKKGEKYIDKSVNFKLYGWCCPMKNDNCDIVLDFKDVDKNKFNTENDVNILK